MHKLEVDVKLLRPTAIDKQQPYWIWGDNDEKYEEIVELLADEGQEKTSTSVEEKDEEVEETATLPSSSKVSMSFLQYKRNNKVNGTHL